LFELFIFFEQSDHIFEARMKWVSGGDLISDGFGTAIGNLRLRCFF